MNPFIHAWIISYSNLAFGIEYRNCHQTLDVYLHCTTYSAWANSIKTKLQTCNLQTGQSISYKYVNQFWLNLSHNNFDIQCQFKNTLNMTWSAHKMENKSRQTASWGSDVVGAQRTKDRRAILISINRPILLYPQWLDNFFPP